jgi:hypothetical protein
MAASSQRRFEARSIVHRQRRQAIVVSVRPAKFERSVAALDITGFVQTASKRRHDLCRSLGRGGMQETDDRNFRLLRACRARPARCRASQKRDELAPPHSIAQSWNKASRRFPG